jgi:hypothetical protein
MLRKLASRPIDTAYLSDTLTDTTFVTVPQVELQKVFILDSICSYERDSLQRALALEQAKGCPEPKISWVKTCAICAGVGFVASLAITR